MYIKTESSADFLFSLLKLFCYNIFALLLYKYFLYLLPTFSCLTDFNSTLNISKLLNDIRKSSNIFVTLIVTNYEIEFVSFYLP